MAKAIGESTERTRSLLEDECRRGFVVKAADGTYALSWWAQEEFGAALAAVSDQAQLYGVRVPVVSDLQGERP